MNPRAVREPAHRPRCARDSLSRMGYPAGALAAIAWTLAGITAVILLFSGNAGLMAREMLDAAPPGTTGLPAGEYEGVCRMITDYLTDRTDRFQYRYTGADGTEIQCFQPHEEAHMADVRELIRLDRRVMWGSLGAAILLTAIGAVGKARREFRRGLRGGLCAVAGIAAILGAWAAIDFDGFFVTFHRLAFTNDGWLLNPRTDLLIRLMPVRFFISLGWKGALAATAVPILAAAVPAMIERIMTSNRKEFHE